MVLKGDKMIVLTGSIATGKSSTCKILQENGFAIVDADKIAKRLIDANIIKNLFGSNYIKDDQIDRIALGNLIFNDAKKRKILNDYIHPLIREEIAKEVSELTKEDKKYIADIPLYFESGRYEADLAVLVYCPRDEQIQRLMQRNNLTKEEAVKRVESQVDIEEKRKKADYVIDNSSDKKNLEKESKKLIKYLEGR